MIGFSGPGEEWREVGAGDVNTKDQRVMSWDEKCGMRYWVPREPVPPLPNEEDTVIRVTWRDQRQTSRLIRNSDGTWSPQGGGVYADEYVRAQITGFEVLAAPVFKARDWSEAEDRVRRETAAAVIRQFKDELGPGAGYTAWEYFCQQITREFGVEQ